MCLEVAQALSHGRLKRSKFVENKLTYFLIDFVGLPFTINRDPDRPFERGRKINSPYFSCRAIGVPTEADE